MTVFARTEDVANAQAYMKAATMVVPLIHRWLGTEPRGTLNIVDLPETGDAPFEDGSVLFTDVQSAEPYKLGDTLIHSLTHLYFRSPYPWLQEGVPSFMGSLWLEQNQGRTLPFSNWIIPVARSRWPSRAMLLRRSQALVTARDPVTTAPRRLMFSGCCATWPGKTPWRAHCVSINRVGYDGNGV